MHFTDSFKNDTAGKIKKIQRVVTTSVLSVVENAYSTFTLFNFSHLHIFLTVRNK